MLTKVCSMCKQELPKTHEYFSHHVKPSGTIVFDSRCKSCAAALKRQKRRKNPEHERALDRERYKRDHEKRLNMIRNYNQIHRNELVARMKVRWIEKGKQYKAAEHIKRLNNPEFYRERQRNDRRKHPERYSTYDKNKRAKRKKAEGRYTLRDELDQRTKQGNRCFWCSRELEGGKSHVDHIIPLVRGGTNWPDNIAITCPSCNLSKGTKLPYIEWQPPNPLNLD